MLKERDDSGLRYCIGVREGEVVIDNRLLIEPFVEPCNELKTAQVWIIREGDRGRIRAYDDPNLCIYIRSKTDSQTSKLAECDKRIIIIKRRKATRINITPRGITMEVQSYTMK